MGRGCRFSANPPARMISVAPAPGARSNVNRPSGPVTVCASVPESLWTITVAPDTAPPLWSRTTPVTVNWTNDKARHAKNIVTLTFHCFRSGCADRSGAAGDHAPLALYIG